MAFYTRSYADRMHIACCDGDTKVVQAMLRQGADVNAPVWEDTTALMWASDYGHPETVKVLLAAGADVNAESSHFGSVASWGASSGSKASKYANGVSYQFCNCAFDREIL